MPRTRFLGRRMGCVSGPASNLCVPFQVEPLTACATRWCVGAQPNRWVLKRDPVIPAWAEAAAEEVPTCGDRPRASSTASPREESVPDGHHVPGGWALKTSCLSGCRQDRVPQAADCAASLRGSRLDQSAGDLYLVLPGDIHR